MAINQKRKQKALLKKRRKEKERRKKRAHLSGSNVFSDKIHIIKNSKSHPVHECLIDKKWQDLGMAQILLSRRQPNGKLMFGVYLVDIYCLGLKNTFCDANFSQQEYRRLKLETFKGAVMVPSSPGEVSKIIFGAIEYAEKLGFKPHKDFDLSHYVLKGLPIDEYDLKTEFGYKGEPFYVAGPDDDFEAIMKALRNNLGEGNFRFVHPLQ